MSTTADAAHAEIVRLCEGGRWRMTIPVDLERDSDIILSRAVAALERVEALADEWEQHIADCAGCDFGDPLIELRATLTRPAERVGQATTEEDDR